MAFVLFQTLGALYLFYLAYQAIKHRNDPLTVNTEKHEVNHKKLLVRGFFMNVLNPKAALIFGSLGYFAGSFGDWILKKPGFSKAMNIVSATVFCGLGLKLITSRR